MYTCKGCGGYLKFDIDSQTLKCDSCGQGYNVPDESSQSMAAETYDTKIYTCPQCGGELTGEDNESVVFCSFCGSSNALTERMSKEKRPNLIIPFKISKEKCKEIYINRVKKAKFAPSDLKTPENIESFRGIYMPFYLYDQKVNNEVYFETQHSERHGDDEYIDDYAFKGHVDAEVNGIPHDASSTFADDISESITPYDLEGSKPFSTGYMAGFYADTTDVDKSLYADEARQTAVEGIVDYLDKMPALKGTAIKDRKKVEMQVKPEMQETQIGLYPVWFLSYKKGSRIAYAAINGQTGRIALDIPVDMKKFFLWTGIFTIPFFLIANIFLTPSPMITMLIAGLFTFIGLFISIATQKNLNDTLTGAKDKGRGVKGKKSKRIMPFILLSLAAIVITAITALASPVSDAPYYYVTIINIVVVMVEMISLAKLYNTISTRALPQFKRTGGDDRA